MHMLYMHIYMYKQCNIPFHGSVIVSTWYNALFGARFVAGSEMASQMFNCVIKIYRNTATLIKKQHFKNNEFCAGWRFYAYQHV